MNRVTLAPRKGWESIVEAQGFTFHTRDTGPYWDESAAYSFNQNDVSVLETATEELQQLCLKAAQYIIDQELFSELRIPAIAWPLIRDSWERETPSVYGRFDLAYDGKSEPKLLEYNAQTPTSLLEAAAIQWLWKEDVRPRNDQFNSIEPKLQSQWQECLPCMNRRLYFSSLDNAEDRATVDYLGSLAESVGFRVNHITLERLGWLNGRFVDEADIPIDGVFALYPWEWLVAEQGTKISGSFSSTVWMEPAWKMLWSNKGLLPVLWKLFPGHPNLLESYLDTPRDMKAYVRKPIYSREGANVTVVDSITVANTEGLYGSEGFVYQKLANLSQFGGKQAVIGSWYITDQGPAGIGVRESDGLITDTRARFVPHFLE
jgi:glutathionylspermidine synthase